MIKKKKKSLDLRAEKSVDEDKFGKDEHDPYVGKDRST